MSKQYPYEVPTALPPQLNDLVTWLISRHQQWTHQPLLLVNEVVVFIQSLPPSQQQPLMSELTNLSLAQLRALFIHNGFRRLGFDLDLTTEILTNLPTLWANSQQRPTRISSVLKRTLRKNFLLFSGPVAMRFYQAWHLPIPSQITSHQDSSPSWWQRCWWMRRYRYSVYGLIGITLVIIGWKLLLLFLPKNS